MHWTPFDDGPFKTPVHADLIQALKNLRPHYAMLAGYINPATVRDIKNIKEDAVDNFHVHAVSIAGKEDDPGVTLSGHYNTPLGKPHNFNTPFYRFSEDEKNYKFIKDLVAKVKRVMEVEAVAYFDGTKRGTDPQQSLFENNNGVQKTEPASEEVTEEATV
jgi:hypothetical protein